MNRSVRALAVLAALSSSGLPLLAHADEGMWTFDNLPTQQMQDKYRFVPDKAWLDHAQRSSVRIPGCSGSFVSGDGLIMTNHHCVEQCLQALSAQQKTDARASGFLAKTRADEFSCPGAEAEQLLTTEDVTTKVTEATKGVTGDGFHKALESVSRSLETACVGKDKETIRCQVVDLYHGGQYSLYRYKRFKDVRLVMAPEFDIASFGGDPDNFNFPRYDYDVSFLRAWEGSAPAKSPDHFAWSPAGAKAGDEIFVTGNPGHTDRLFTVAELENERDLLHPRAMEGLALARGRLHEMEREGDHLAQLADAQLEFVENAVKEVRGEEAALLKPELMDRKRAEEADMRAAVAKNPALAASIGDPWADMAKAVAAERTQFDRHGAMARGFGSQMMITATTLVRAAVERPKPSAERLPEFADVSLPQMEQRLFSKRPIFPEMEERGMASSLYSMRDRLGADDPLVKEILGTSSPEALAKDLVAKSTLADIATRKALWEGGESAIEASTDPMIVLARRIDPTLRAIRKKHEVEVEGPMEQASEKVARAWFAVHGKSAYPDATFTLRLSYGMVKGWTRADGVEIAPNTTLAGAFDRATADEPYVMPKSWLDAKAALKLDTPFDFVTDNDITGGNSGSPMLDSKGRIVGIAFDGNIESLGGTYFFDSSVNRCVGVTSQAIMEGLRTVYHDDALADEIAGKAPAAGKARKTTLR